MAALSSANTTYTVEQLAKTSGISAETLANWGLISSTDTLTMAELAEKAASDAQAKKVLEKVIANNAQAVANGEVTASTIALSTSEGAATMATGTFTTAIKANISAMITWMTTTPLGWLTMIVGGVFLAVKAYDALTVSVKEQQERMEQAISTYNDARSELSNTTSELENQEQEMDKLLDKEKLTYAEKGQLAELKEITAELRVQKDLNEKKVEKTKKDSATEASKLYKKQFGKYEISDEKINEYEHNADLGGNNAILVSDENNISSMLAGYRQFMELRKQAYADGDQYNIDHFTELTDDLRANIFETAQSLQEQKDAMYDYYLSLRNIPYDNLAPAQKEVVDSYNAISSAIRLIYKELDPQSWNSMQLSDVFSVEGVEKTKDELVEMATAGTLSEETLKSYPKLYKAIQDGNLILEDGETATGVFCDEIYALASASNEGSTNIAQLRQQLSDYRQALNEEYKKIDEWGLGDYADEIKDGTLQTVFGNVDMDKRTIINWTDELKETYKDALASWDYNPEVGSVDTVFGMSERFGEDLNGSGWEVAFTPILPDGTFLSRDTVSEYINSILSEAYANDGKVTEDELKEIDAQGKQIGNTFVKGIFAGVDASEDYGEDGNGNKASLFGKLMHFAGNFGAIKINTKGTEDATNAIKAAADAGDKATASLSDLEKVSDNIGKLSSAYKELNDNGYITIKTINELQTATGLSGDEWAEYETKLLNAKKDSAEFNQVMSDLTYKMIENQLSVGDLTNATDEEVKAIENKIAATLRENGVTNASAVAHDYVAKKKLEAKYASIKLADGVELDIAALKNEATTCGVTTNAYLELIAKEILFNRNDLDVSDRIKKLNQIAVAAGVATINMQSLSAQFGTQESKIRYAEENGVSVKTTNGVFGANGLFGTGFGKNLGVKTTYTLSDGTTTENFEEVCGFIEGQKLVDEISSQTVDIKIPQYSPKSSGGSSKSSSDKNDALGNYLEDAERRYKIHQDETKYINDLDYALSNLVKTEEERRDVLDKIEQARKDYADNQVKDLEHQIEMVQNLKGENADVLDYYKQIQEISHNEANRLRSIGYDDNSDEIQEWQSKWWDAQSKKLDFYNTQHEVIIRDIEHARDMALAKNPYADTTSYYKQMQDEYHKMAEMYRSINPEKYKAEIQELQQAWWDAQSSIVDWRWENSQNWISQRNAFDDWSLFDDSEVKACERVLKWLKTEYPDALEKIREAEQSLYEARKNEFQNVESQFEKHVSKIKERIQKTVEKLDDRLAKEKALLSIYQKQYDVQNALDEALHEADKAIAVSRVSYDYLDEDVVKNIYNEDDYQKETKKIKELSDDVDALTTRFIKDIGEAYSDENLYLIESITAEYERQCSLKEQELKIVKAEIDLQKKQEKLNNILAEKNVRLLKDGQWVWTYDVDKAQQATEELEDAQYTIESLEKQRNQQAILDEQQSLIDSIENQKGVYDKQLKGIDEAVEKLSSSIENIIDPISSVGDLADVLATQGVAKINKAVNGLLKAFSRITDEDYGTVASTSEEITSSKILSGKASKPLFHLPTNAYAKGTSKTLKGSALMGENGFEAYIDKDGHLLPVVQPTLFENIEADGKVFNAEQLNNLGVLWQASKLNFSLPKTNIPQLTEKLQNIDQSIHYSIESVEVNKPADLNGFVRELSAKVSSINAITNK